MKKIFMSLSVAVLGTAQAFAQSANEVAEVAQDTTAQAVAEVAEAEFHVSILSVILHFAPPR